MKKLLKINLFTLALLSFNLHGQEISFEGQEMIITPIKAAQHAARTYASPEEKNFIRRLEREHNLYKDMTPQQIADQRTQSAIDSRNAEERYNARHGLTSHQIDRGIANVQPPHSATFTCSDCHENFLLTDSYNHKKFYCIKLSCKISDSCQYLMFSNKEQLKLHLKYEHKLSDWVIENIYKLK